MPWRARYHRRVPPQEPDAAAHRGRGDERDVERVAYLVATGHGVGHRRHAAMKTGASFRFVEHTRQGLEADSDAEDDGRGFWQSGQDLLLHAQPRLRHVERRAKPRPRRP